MGGNYLMYKYFLSFFKSQNVDHFFKNATLETILTQSLMHTTEMI